jgi:hypothetical protein
MELIVTALVPLIVRTSERELLSPVLMLPKGREVTLDTNVVCADAIPVPITSDNNKRPL